MSGKRSGDKLSLDDLAKIIEDVHDAVDKWHNIGIQLGLHESELKSIESNYPRQNDRLREMICKWLQNKVATWGKMVRALKSRTVGEGYLAEQLESKYCVPLQRITLTTTKISKSTEVSESVDVWPAAAAGPGSEVPPSTPSPSQSSKVATGSQQKPAATFPGPSAAGARGGGNRKRAAVDPTGAVASPKKVTKVSSSNKAPSSFSDDQFVTPQPSELHCIKCKRVPQHPKRSICCNTLYCEPCSQTIGQCPVHKAKLEFSTDTELKSRIAKWTIYCENKCGWKGVVHKLKEHLPECIGKKPESSTSYSASITPSSSSITKPAAAAGGGTISYQTSAKTKTKTKTTSKASSITLAASHHDQPAHLSSLQPPGASSYDTAQEQSFSPFTKPQGMNVAAELSPLYSQPSTTTAGVLDSPKVPTGQYYASPAMASGNLPSVQSPHDPCKPSGSTGTGQKSSSSVSVDMLYSELKRISTKWHKLGGVLKIGQLEEIRTTNKNDPDRCMYALLKELVGIKGGSPYKKLCKALESDIISEKALAEGLKSKFGSTNIRITLKTKGGGSTVSSQVVPTTSIVPSQPQQSEQPPKPHPQPHPHLQQEQVVEHSPVVDRDSFSDSDFVNPLPPELHCVLCKKVPRKPRRSKCCNTLYCEPCSKVQELCPAHKQKKEYTADSDLRSKVSKLHLHCIRKCGWKGTWAKMKEHLKECGLEKKGVEVLATAGTGSMTITELMTTTTHLHTKTTTIGPSQLPCDQQAVGGALPAGGGAASGEPTMGGVMPGQWGIGQSSSGAAGVQSQKKALIQFGDAPKMDLLYLIKYTRSDGREHTLKLIDKLAPFWKRMGYLLGISTDQLSSWELMYGNPSNCSEAVLSHFLQNGSQGTYVYPQTWGGVVKLLQDLDLKNIAEEIQSIAC